MALDDVGMVEGLDDCNFRLEHLSVLAGVLLQIDHLYGEHLRTSITTPSVNLARIAMSNAVTQPVRIVFNSLLN